MLPVIKSVFGTQNGVLKQSLALVMVSGASASANLSRNTLLKISRDIIEDILDF
jgi:hypothetical protein